MGSSQKRRKTGKTLPAETPLPHPPSKTSLPAIEDEVSQKSLTPTPGSSSLTASSSDASKKDAVSSAKSLAIESSSAKELKPRSSWYGTWPRKSAASTQVARETILANKSSNLGPTNDSSTRVSKTRTPSIASRPPSMNLGKGKETLDVTMGGTLEEQTLRRDGPVDQKSKPTEDKLGSTEVPESQPLLAKVAEEAEPTSQPTGVRPTKSSGWLGGWLGKPISLPAEAAPEQSDSASLASKTLTDARTTEPADAPSDGIEENRPPTSASRAPTSSTSWFGLWSTAALSTAAEAPKEQIPVKVAEDSTDTVMHDAPSADAPTQAALPIQPAAGSSWAFWSTDATKKAPALPEKKEETGELAIIGEPSQENPERAKTATKETKKGKVAKKGNSKSAELENTTTVTESPTSKAATPVQTPVKASPPNLLIPSVKSTYRLCENPSILQQIARLLQIGQQQPVKHVFLAKDSPKIKNALAIGIHGLFPAPLLRTVIGQPTGTSIRFANHAADAIRRWTDAHGCVDCGIEKVALEGEGKIADRVDNLWNLLLNWIDHVRKADFILVACHSQGVPVAVMLVAKLVEFGVVTTGKIGICAMAGVSLGPFADYKSRLFSGSAGELFEFADPESTVSKRYEDSLRVALKYGVKVTYCGSIDDQLVSMESSIFSNASHPYIFRAVFVDGRIHAPDFLSHLVGFALKLRNLGVSDHGLIRELSAPLAGSLYTGEGHSRLYDDGKVYDLAIEYALETTTISDVPLDMKKYEIPTNPNPFVLPWIMRGLLEEDFVKTELSTETSELLKQFDDWKPSTKVLKDVKYRLEAVRSKL